MVEGDALAGGGLVGGEDAVGDDGADGVAADVRLLFEVEAVVVGWWD